jgi:hypothetical protein
MNNTALKMTSSSTPFFSQSLQAADPAIFKGIGDELNRQQTQIELIASENIASKADTLEDFIIDWNQTAKNELTHPVP